MSRIILSCLNLQLLYIEYVQYRKTIGKDPTQPFLPNPNIITPLLEICQVHKIVYLQYSTKY